MATCSTSSLLADATQFVAVPPGTIFPVKLALLCRIAKSLNPSFDCSPQSLLETASCFLCLPSAVLRIIKLQLLCQITGSIVPSPSFSPQAPQVNILGEELDATNLDCPDHPVDDPTFDNWQGFSSVTGIGNPTTDPGEWVDLGAAGLGEACSAAWAAAIVPGSWGAVRFLTGGVWSPWGKALNP